MPPAKSKEGDWGEYRRLILAELERMSLSIGHVDKKVDLLVQTEMSGIKTEIAVLKTKVAMIGVAAGTGAGLAVTIIGHFIK